MSLKRTSLADDCTFCRNARDSFSYSCVSNTLKDSAVGDYMASPQTRVCQGPYMFLSPFSESSISLKKKKNRFLQLRLPKGWLPEKQCFYNDYVSVQTYHFQYDGNEFNLFLYFIELQRFLFLITFNKHFANLLVQRLEKMETKSGCLMNGLTFTDL